MPRIYDAIIHSVFYIFRSKQEAIDGENGGTGFFYFVRSEVNPKVGYLYAVTCAHIVFEDGFEQPVIRMNTKNNKFDLIVTERDEWERHPYGGDIAACLIRLTPDTYRWGHYAKEHLLDQEFIKEQNVGLGDEVSMAGGFWGFVGQKKNTPVIRFGNISMMPDEPIFNWFTGLEEPAYLVEMRSASGYSGSPALLFIPPFSERHIGEITEGEKIPIEQFGQWHVRLMGINWGHIVQREPVLDQSGNIHFDKMSVKINTTMACVTPIEKLLDIIDGDVLKKQREESEANMKKAVGKSAVELD